MHPSAAPVKLPIKGAALFPVPAREARDHLIRLTTAMTGQIQGPPRRGPHCDAKAPRLKVATDQSPGLCTAPQIAERAARDGRGTGVAARSHRGRYFYAMPRPIARPAAAALLLHCKAGVTAVGPRLAVVIQSEAFRQLRDAARRHDAGEGTTRPTDTTA